MDAPPLAPVPSRDPIAELLDAARYAAEYLSPCPPAEGKPGKAGLILAAAIRRMERHLASQR